MVCKVRSKPRKHQQGAGAKSSKAKKHRNGEIKRESKPSRQRMDLLKTKNRGNQGNISTHGKEGAIIGTTTRRSKKKKGVGWRRFWQQVKKNKKLGGEGIKNQIQIRLEFSNIA